MKVITKGCSEIGKREVQQDRYVFGNFNGVVFIALCDGNGGEGGAELAQAGTKSALGYFCWELSQGRDISTEDNVKALAMDVVNFAAEEVMSIKKSNSEWGGAGTTITVVVISSHYVASAWIGDSPALLYRNDGGVVNLTAPLHTLKEQMIGEGFSREGLKNQPGLSSVLVRCAGHKESKPDSIVVPAWPPGVVLVGSDGVLDYVTDEDIRSVLRSSCFCCGPAPERIIERSLAKGSCDNLTLVISNFTQVVQPE